MWIYTKTKVHFYRWSCRLICRLDFIATFFFEFIFCCIPSKSVTKLRNLCVNFDCFFHFIYFFLFCSIYLYFFQHDLFFKIVVQSRAQPKIGTIDDFENKKVNENITRRRLTLKKEEEHCVQINMCFWLILFCIDESEIVRLCIVDNKRKKRHVFMLFVLIRIDQSVNYLFE